METHTEVPIAYNQAFLGKQVQRKQTNTAAKEKPLIC